MKTGITQMREWLDNRDRHSGKIRMAEMRYIRTKCHELEAQEKSRAEKDILITPEMLLQIVKAGTAESEYWNMLNHKKGQLIFRMEGTE